MKETPLKFVKFMKFALKFSNSHCVRAASVTLLGLALTGLVIGQFTARAQSPGVSGASKKVTNSVRPKGAVTFAHDIAPLLYNNCATCHRAGEVAPFTLGSYKDAKKRAQQIALVTESHLMPPWKADAHGMFQDERRLTDAQIALLKQWTEDGAPEGNPAETPPAPKFPAGWALGKPDMVVQPTAAHKVAAEGRDEYRCYVVPTDFTEDRWVSALDVHPGNRAIVHHIIAYVDTAGRARKRAAQDPSPDNGYTTFGGIGFLPSGMLGGWAPGATAHYLPADTGILLPKGADIILEVHYHKNGKPETDLSQVALYFNKGVVEKPFHIFPLLNHTFLIPPGEKDYEAKASHFVPANATIINVFPHMHLLGKIMTVTATLPDGTTRQIVDVPDWDFNWQGFYYYKNPIKLPAGSKVNLVAHYDNSATNPRNPSAPPRAVTWGEQTIDEMCLCYLGFTLDAEHIDKVSKGGKSVAAK
jgi:mono/diheme cytochrome c family protein